MRWFRKKDSFVPAPHMAVPLIDAWLCCDCTYVIEGAPYGRCQRCGSSQILNLQMILDGAPVQPVAQPPVPKPKRPTCTNELAFLTEFRED